MPNNAIETSHLYRSFGHVQAVQDLSMCIGAGEIYGFLGLNGAGKTTTIRCLLGMIKPINGSVRLFGQLVEPGGRGPWSRVGHLVESAVAYPELTVRENLEMARRLQGLRSSARVPSVIELLHLEPYAHRRAGTLSLGNLQRLGLARALLHEPELLILDEPANGLDPAGVVEIRELLACLRRERGVTILMSSHILTEVDRLATRIGIIHQGRLIEELDPESMERLRDRRLLVQSRDTARAGSVLAAAGYHWSQAPASDALITKDARALEYPDDVARLLVEAGAAPTRLCIEQEDLEDHFLRLTGGRK
jgi:ABC-2 type transport system ATP-binding protein